MGEVLPGKDGTHQIKLTVKASRLTFGAIQIRIIQSYRLFTLKDRDECEGVY